MMSTIEEATVFLFNVKTTGFFSYSKTKKQDICQIGALSYTGASQFCRYIIPSTNFDHRATADSGFIKNGKKILLLNQQEVEDTVSERQAITDFVDFLKTNSEPGSTLFLIGYNSKGHDFPFLTKAFIDCGIPMVIEGRTLIFTDAFPLIKKIAKDAKDPLGQTLASFKSKKRQIVHRKLFGTTSYNDTETHDAIRDIKQLKDITTRFNLERLREHIVSTDDLVAKIEKSQAQETQMPIKPTEEDSPSLLRKRKFDHDMENDYGLKETKKMKSQHS